MFNDVTAKCAEDLVLSSAKSEEVAAMVARCARFRVEAGVTRCPYIASRLYGGWVGKAHPRTTARGS